LNNNGKPLCSKENLTVIRSCASELDKFGNLKLVEHYRAKEPYLHAEAIRFADKVIEGYPLLQEPDNINVKNAISQDLKTTFLYGYMLRDKLAEIRFNEDFEGQFEWLTEGK